MSSSYFMIQFLKIENLKNQQQLLNQGSVASHNSYESRPVVPTTSEKNKCRICLKEATISIYSSDSTYNIAEAIRTIGDIKISENDDHPKHLCSSCQAMLQSAMLFRKLAQETDNLLRQTPIIDEQFDKLISYGEAIKSYICKQCNINFKTFNELIAHKNTIVHKKVRIQCPLCFRLLTTKLYKKHLARHQSETHLVCDVCGKLYRKDNLARHLQLHSYDLPFKCQHCPYKGRFMESLKIHTRTHTGVKPFSCTQCELRFITRSNLNRHLLTHQKERPFKCDDCGRGFYTKRDMEAHFRTDHTGLKEFACWLCSNKYGSQKALMRHELRVHKRDKMAKGRKPLYLQAEYQKHDECIPQLSMSEDLKQLGNNNGVVGSELK